MTSSNAHTYFDHPDSDGTERMRTKYDGTVDGTFASLPFGDGYTVTSGEDVDSRHFAMLDQDNGSDEHAKFREYSNMTGRWMSPDPYLGSYDPSNPQSMNRYSYVLNDPLSYVDPDGTSWVYNGDSWEWCVSSNSCTSESDLMGSSLGMYDPSMQAPNEMAINMPNLAAMTNSGSALANDVLNATGCAAEQNSASDSGCWGYKASWKNGMLTGGWSFDQWASAVYAYENPPQYPASNYIVQDLGVTPLVVGHGSGTINKNYNCADLSIEINQLMQEPDPDMKELTQLKIEYRKNCPL